MIQINNDNINFKINIIFYMYKISNQLRIFNYKYVKRILWLEKTQFYKNLLNSLKIYSKTFLLNTANNRNFNFIMNSPGIIWNLYYLLTLLIVSECFFYSRATEKSQYLICFCWLRNVMSFVRVRTRIDFLNKFCNVPRTTVIDLA